MFRFENHLDKESHFWISVLHQEKKNTYITPGNDLMKDVLSQRSSTSSSNLSSVSITSEACSNFVKYVWNSQWKNSTLKRKKKEKTLSP